MLRLGGVTGAVKRCELSCTFSEFSKVEVFVALGRAHTCITL
jgi:hypothetical protein